MHESGKGGLSAAAVKEILCHQRTSLLIRCDPLCCKFSILEMKVLTLVQLQNKTL